MLGRSLPAALDSCGQVMSSRPCLSPPRHGRQQPSSLCQVSTKGSNACPHVPQETKKPDKFCDDRVAIFQVRPLTRLSACRTEVTPGGGGAGWRCHSPCPHRRAVQHSATQRSLRLPCASPHPAANRGRLPSLRWPRPGAVKGLAAFSAVPAHAGASGAVRPAPGRARHVGHRARARRYNYPAITPAQGRWAIGLSTPPLFPHMLLSHPAGGCTGPGP